MTPTCCGWLSLLLSGSFSLSLSSVVPRIEISLHESSLLSIISYHCSDGLAAEHFLYSHERIFVHLAMLHFTSMLTHEYLPDAFRTTSIIPTLKNKNGITSVRNNYRPIAIVTAMSKIL